MRYAKTFRPSSPILAAILMAGLLLLYVAPVTAHAAAPEKLTAPFSGGRTAVTTQNAYTSGDVALKVSGVGQASGTQCSDAFYVFAEASETAGQCGASITPVPAAIFGLFINGQPAENFMVTATPPFRKNHKYRFVITITGDPVKLTFGVGDLFVADNTGQYRISVRESHK